MLRIAESEFSDLITLIEGDSVSPTVVEKVKALVQAEEKVFVFLDSDHHKSHVLNELDAYAGLVTPGSYIVATDGVMESLSDTPTGNRSGFWITLLLRHVNLSKLTPSL